MEKVIVTGATGFLGKSLLCYLLKQEIEVVAVVRDATKLADIESQYLCVVEAEFKDYAKLDQLIGKPVYDAFYHFAWEGTSGLQRENYVIQVRNIRAACEAVNAAKKLGCAKFISAGSLMEYEAIKLMQTQEIGPAGNYLYRSAKLAAHYMAKSEAGRIGLPFINLIISNIYGKGEISNRLISVTLQSLVQSKSVSYTAGTQLYDFINIDDAVEAFYKVGEFGQTYHDYYIGSNQIRPLCDYIEEMYDCLPVNQKPFFGYVSHDGISLSYDEFDRDALFRDTGFQCKISFRDGILAAYKWMEKMYGTKLESKGA